jgi:hypothetical protein
MRNIICLLAFLVWSCVTDAKHTKEIKWKYALGECVRFNPAKFKNSDGTPMLIVSIVDKTGLYWVRMEHPLVPGVTLFTALRVPFERDTITTPCKKSTK